MTKNYYLPITEKKQVAEDTIEISFDTKDTDLSFVPGQYIWITIPEPKEKDDRGDTRAFSISSGPEEDRISIILRTPKDSSAFKKNLLNMSTGEKVKVIGPFGFFTTEAEKDQVFIAGGVGISPFLSSLQEKNFLTDKKAALIYFDSKKERMAYADFLEKLAEENKNFQFIPKFGVPDKQFLGDNIKNFKDRIFYISGPQKMVVEISDMLKELGISRNNMRFDQYFGRGDIKRGKPNENIDINKFKLAVESSSNHIIITDIDGFIEYANPAAEKTTGFTITEMIGQTPRLWGGMMGLEFYRKMWKSIKEDKKAFLGEIKNRRKNGEEYIALTRISPVFDENQNLINFIGTEEDITKEKEIDREKTEFVSLASHQLRTPLATTKWYVELLERILRSRENADKEISYIQEISLSNQRMISLVNSLLDASRIELGKVSIEPKEVDIIPFIKKMIEGFGFIIKNKQIKFTEKYAENIGNIYIDEKILEIVVQNLVSNALDYTNDKGEISIEIKKNDDDLNIIVSDDGVGIPEKERSKIYSKFFRTENAKILNTKGSGLGLYIVKYMLEKIGGSINFNSEIDKGTTFYVKIPIKQ